MWLIHACLISSQHARTCMAGVAALLSVASFLIELAGQVAFAVLDPPDQASGGGAPNSSLWRWLWLLGIRRCQAPLPLIWAMGPPILSAFLSARRYFTAERSSHPTPNRFLATAATSLVPAAALLWPCSAGMPYAAISALALGRWAGVATGKASTGLPLGSRAILLLLLYCCAHLLLQFASLAAPLRQSMPGFDAVAQALGLYAWGSTGRGWAGISWVELIPQAAHLVSLHLLVFALAEVLRKDRVRSNQGLAEAQQPLLSADHVTEEPQEPREEQCRPGDRQQASDQPEATADGVLGLALKALGSSIKPAALALICVAMLEVSLLGCICLVIGFVLLTLPHR